RLNRFWRAVVPSTGAHYRHPFKTRKALFQKNDRSTKKQPKARRMAELPANSDEITNKFCTLIESTRAEVP
ncbi:MAG: hypothetical protein R3Y10_13520, partial [Ferrimonas sp.]